MENACCSAPVLCCLPLPAPMLLCKLLGAAASHSESSTNPTYQPNPTLCVLPLRSAARAQADPAPPAQLWTRCLVSRVCCAAHAQPAAALLAAHASQPARTEWQPPARVCEVCCAECAVLSTPCWPLHKSNDAAAPHVFMALSLGSGCCPFHVSCLALNECCLCVFCRYDHSRVLDSARFVQVGRERCCASSSPIMRSAWQLGAAPMLAAMLHAVLHPRCVHAMPCQPCRGHAPQPCHAMLHHAMPLCHAHPTLLHAHWFRDSGRAAQAAATACSPAVPCAPIPCRRRSCPSGWRGA